MYIIDVWADLGGLAPAGEYNPMFSWDDSIISDRKAEFAEKLQLVQSEILGSRRAAFMGIQERILKPLVKIFRRAELRSDNFCLLLNF